MILAGVIFFLGMLFQFTNLAEFPVGHHAWTQIDHYAMSLRFQETGYDFFHPQTYTYNREHEDGGVTNIKSTITATDFPLHQYAVSLLMYVFGDSSVIVFRTYVLIYSFFGLYFLGRLVFLLCSRFESALLIVIMAATTPLFVYFQTAMMPSIPSWANAVIGLYFWVSYLHTKRKPQYVLAIAFLTLAALTRMTFAIPLLALIGFELIQFLKTRSFRKYKAMSLLVSVSLFMAYYVYNAVLREKYGSNFLSSFLPARNLNEAYEWIGIVIDSWSQHYLTTYHYALLLCVLSIATWVLLKAKSRLNAIHIRVMTFLVIYFTGCLLFAALMLQQFINHDYYFLDTFYIPVFLVLSIALSLIPAPKFKIFPWLSYAAIVLLLIPVGINAKQSIQNLKHDDWWNRTAATHRNFIGSEHLLEALKIPENADILVLDAYAPNLPFVHIRRTGHALINTKTEYIAEAMKWKWDFAIIQNEYFFSDVYRSFPKITEHLHFVGTNGKISVYERSESRRNQNLETFLAINDRTPVVESQFSENGTGTGWKTPPLQSGVYASNEEFPLSFTYPVDSIRSRNNLEVFVVIESMLSPESNVELVMSLKSSDSTTYYRSYHQNYNEQYPETEIGLLVPLSEIRDIEGEMVIYLWNPKKTRIDLKSGRVQILSSKELIQHETSGSYE